MAGTEQRPTDLRRARRALLDWLLLVTFLLGLLPTLLFHHAVRWRLRSRLTSLERTVEGLRPAPSDPVAVTPEPVAEPPVARPPPGALL